MNESTITFGQGIDNVWGQIGKGQREVVIALPHGIVSRAHIDAARAFIRRTVPKLNQADTDAEMAALIEQAKNTLGAIENAASFLQAVPEMPW